MPQFSIRLSEEYADLAAVYDALHAYNLTKTGMDPNEKVQTPVLPEQYALVVEDESGKFCGGLSFHWENNPRRISADYFQMNSSVRGQGIGTRVMDELFAIAKRGGAASIELCTNAFQAPGFYRKLGFTVTKEVPNSYPASPDNVCYYMIYTF